MVLINQKLTSSNDIVINDRKMWQCLIIEKSVDYYCNFLINTNIQLVCFNIL
jgi:hypothetical protein